MSRKRAFVIVFALALISLLSLDLFDYQGKSPQKKPRPGGTLRVRPPRDSFEPKFDPAKGGAIFVIEQIFDGLVRLDNNLNIVPALAEYWVISDEGRKYTFYLRQRVKFHHGQEVTAVDVKFSLERLVNKEVMSDFSQILLNKVVGAQEFWEGRADHVAGFVIKDKYVFEIQWKHPFVSDSALYLLSLYFCKILPRDLVTSEGDDFFNKPSGTGPFKYAYWVRSPRLDIMGVRLVRNEVYFGRKPFLEAIEFSPYFTSDHFMDREVDIIPYLSESFSRTDCQVVEDSQFELVFLVMSVHLAPLNKSEIRRALAFGINKENIARVAFSLDANSYVLDNYIPPKLPGFFPLEGKKRYDRDKAWQILRDQGFSYDREFPPLNFFLPADRTELFEKVYGGLKKELEPLGIELKVKRYRSLQEVRASREPYLLLIDSILDFPDPEDIIVPCYYSKGRFNLANYSNPNLDKLVEEALVERGASRRTELFRQIEKILMVDVPTIPLFSHQRRLAVQPYVRGLKAHPLGIAYSDMKEVWLDK